MYSNCLEFALTGSLETFKKASLIIRIPLSNNGEDIYTLFSQPARVEKRNATSVKHTS